MRAELAGLLMPKILKCKKCKREFSWVQGYSESKDECYVCLVKKRTMPKGREK